MDTDRHTGKTLYKDEDRDQGDAAEAKGMPKAASKPPEANREGGRGAPLWRSEGTNATNTLISDF